MDEEASIHLQQAVSLGYDDLKNAHEKLAEVYMRQGKLDDALTEIKKAHQHGYKSWFLHLLALWSHMKMRKKAGKPLDREVIIKLIRELCKALQQDQGATSIHPENVYPTEHWNSVQLINYESCEGYMKDYKPPAGKEGSPAQLQVYSAGCIAAALITNDEE